VGAEPIPTPAHEEPLPDAPTVTRPDGLELYKLAYAEAKARVEGQREELTAARNRVVSFLAFIGASTAFLVGSALRGAQRDSTYDVLAIGATVLFGLAVVLALQVLLAVGRRFRRFRWEFHEATEDMLVFIDQMVPSKQDETSLNQHLAYAYRNHWLHNEEMLRTIRKAYVASIALAALQLGLWFAIVWFRGAA
jgi:predicted nucleotidyltransferase